MRILCYQNICQRRVTRSARTKNISERENLAGNYQDQALLKISNAQGILWRSVKRIGLLKTKFSHLDEYRFNWFTDHERSSNKNIRNTHRKKDQISKSQFHINSKTISATKNQKNVEYYLSIFKIGAAILKSCEKQHQNFTK